MVSAQGVHVDPKKIEAVRTWKTPENVKELQQFLGFANYYNRFVPQYAKIATPLTNLLKKNTPFKWEDVHQQAMEQLKTALTSAPVLILPDPEKDYVIEADASDQAVGVVLMQDQGKGLQPIAYLSKKLHGAELNYPIHDKEALAIITAFKTWRCYLEGRKTTVYTDHCSHNPGGGAGGAGSEGAVPTRARSSGGVSTSSQLSAIRHLLNLPPAVTEFLLAGTTPPLQFPLTVQSQPQPLPGSPLPAPAPHTAGDRVLHWA
ncbi:unnamed protein product [Closterium sp. NIES-54]